jgi:hypothetical protein
MNVSLSLLLLCACAALAWPWSSAKGEESDSIKDKIRAAATLQATGDPEHGTCLVESDDAEPDASIKLTFRAPTNPEKPTTTAALGRFHIWPELCFGEPCVRLMACDSANRSKGDCVEVSMTWGLEV